jgi:hypothetical protein
MSVRKFQAGEWVEVRSEEEILQTLDSRGQLDGMPFMPQMLQYCGKRFPVFKRAHKSCDTVRGPAGLQVADAVHLGGLRCDGAAFGGCQAGCLLFWKTAWLKPVGGPPTGERQESVGTAASRKKTCTREDVRAGTLAPKQEDPDDPVYVCQATRLPYASKPLPWWNLAQYVEDYTSGNVTLGTLLRGVLYAAYFNVMQAGIGVGRPMRWLYDKVQALWGGVPFPRRAGSIPAGSPTPSCELNLEPGEMVRVKSHREILATLNTESRNRGLFFDAEAVPYCGKTYRVARRIERILDERTGKLIRFKNPSVVLEGVFCQARYSAHRMFCPRAIDSYWREIWLERSTDGGIDKTLECTSVTGRQV